MSATTVSVAPLVIRRLYTLTTARLTSDVTIEVGLTPGSETLTKALLIGIDDPLFATIGDDAQGQQSFQTFRGGNSNHAGRKDEGEINLCALAWTGDTGTDAMLDTIDSAYSVAAGVDGIVRATPDLNLQADGTIAQIVAEKGRSRHRIIHGESGSSCAVFFTITYQARI
ncbi:MAG: hypothetical protein NVS3B1_26740 [Marmoricola sp.]